MKRRLAALLVAAAASFGAAAIAPATETASWSPAAYAHTCSGSHVHAHLPWGQKCLRRGQFCKLDGDRYYHRHGFHCHRSSRDSRGNFHLR
jgi:Spy/CpxP family protein refolding chaperone